MRMDYFFPERFGVQEAVQVANMLEMPEVFPGESSSLRIIS